MAAAIGRLPLDLEGDPVPPKLFLAPAKDGGAPPDADGTGGAAAPSAASPSALAGGLRMSAGKGGPREGGLHSKCSREALCGGTLLFTNGLQLAFQSRSS